MKHLQIGLLRSITILNSSEEKKAFIEYEYIFQSEIVKKVFELRPQIIGVVNYNYPLLSDPNQGILGVYIEFTYLKKNDLVQIADSLEKLVGIMKEVAIVWKGRENEYSLEKNEQTLKASKVVLQTIKDHNPNSDIDFWNYLCFRELGIYIKV